MKLSSLIGLLPVLWKSGHATEIVSNVRAIGAIVTPIIASRPSLTDKEAIWALLETMASDGRLKALFDLTTKTIEDILPMVNDPVAMKAILDFVEGLE